MRKTDSKRAQDRKIDRERMTQIEMVRRMYGQTDRQTDRQADRQIDRQTDR